MTSVSTNSKAHWLFNSTKGLFGRNRHAVQTSTSRQISPRDDNSLPQQVTSVDIQRPPDTLAKHPKSCFDSVNNESTYSQVHNTHHYSSPSCFVLTCQLKPVGTRYDRSPTHTRTPKVIRDPQTILIINTAEIAKVERSVQKNSIEHRIHLCQEQLQALSTRLVEVDGDLDLVDVDRGVEALREALLQRRALRAELVDVERALNEIQRSIEALRDNIMQATFTDDTNSESSSIRSFDSRSSYTDD
jgi:hypothetical protein